ncbi:uncharacterized protein UHOD_11708 [Ustilago sp. UG-2017b]|nr:uncharacterized protein UHOD_11708 [Ustilago sp. UG-2017b]
MTTSTDDSLDISAQLFWQSTTPTSSATQTKSMPALSQSVLVLYWSRQIVQQLSSCATAIELCDNSSVALRWLGTIDINTKVMVKLVVVMKTPRSGVSGLIDDEVGGDDDTVGGIVDEVGDVGGNSVASTRVSSVVTDAWSDPRTAVDYCLRFYLNPDCWSAMNRLRTSVSGDTTHALQ